MLNHVSLYFKASRGKVDAGFPQERCDIKNLEHRALLKERTLL